VLTTTARGSTVWRTDTGHPVAVLESRAASKGAFSSNGRLVATLDEGAHPGARVFNWKTGRVLHRLAPRIGRKRVELEGVAFSPDNHLLATTGFMGTYLWNTRSGRQVGPLLVDKPGVATAAAFSPDGSLLAVAGEDGGVRIWDVAKGDRLFYFPLHNGPVLAVAWSPDGAFLADGSTDRTVHVLSAGGPLGGRQVGNLVGHRSAVRAVAWSPHGRSLLSGSADGTARLWDAQFDQELLPLAPRRGEVLAASFDPAGQRIVSAASDGAARIWSVRSRHLLRTLRHERAVADAEFSSDGRLVVTASSDGTAGIWSSKTGARLRTLHVGPPVFVARFSPDGTIVMTGDSGGGIRLWRASDGTPLGAGKQHGAVRSAIFARDGKTVASAGLAGVSEWSVPSGKRIRLLRSPGGVSRVAFSPDGTLVAGAGNDGAARIWETTGGERRGLYKISKVGLTDVVFSPDGRLVLATGGVDVQTRVVRTGARQNTLVGHSGPASRVAFSPDGQWIATTGPITVGLWRRRANQPFFFLRRAGIVPKGKLLTSASFSPDGRLVLASGRDGAVRLYRCEICGNLPTLLELATARLRELRG
jgi:WD40 repeat protein